MATSELSIHVSKSEIPKFYLMRYPEDINGPGFTTIKITSEGSPIITIFVDSLQDVVNFKNNCLWACEKHIKEQTP
jgi:hypothetical protein